MKKVIVLLVGVFFMAGCEQIGNYVLDNVSDKESTSESVASTTVTSQEIIEESKSSAASEESSSQSLESKASSKADTQIKADLESTAPEKQSDILFVPQKSEIENGLTVETDTVLQQIEKLVMEADNLGIANDVSLYFTGLYLDNNDRTDAIFIIVNRTDKSMKNVKFSLTFGSADGQMLFENKPYQLAEKSFGVLEPNTAMPLYLTIDQKDKDLLLQISKERQEKIAVNSFNYEEANSENPHSSSSSQNDTGITAGEDSSSASDSSSSSSATEQKSDLPLVPQKDELEHGYTVESDPVLQNIQSVINNTSEIGIENDIAIHYTGLYLDQKEKGTAAIFIIVNRTGMDMKNMNMVVSFWNKNGDKYLDKQKFTLKEDTFGILEDKTIMPVYFNIPSDMEEAYLESGRVENVEYSIDDFNYEKK